MCTWPDVPRLALASLRQLRDFHLEENFLKRLIPDEVAQLSQLHVFSVGFNHFRGRFPIAVCALRQLRHLDLAGTLGNQDQNHFSTPNPQVC